MTDLTALNNSKPKYGTGQFYRETPSILSIQKFNERLAPERYESKAIAIHGSDFKGIFKRFANTLTNDLVYPTKLTEAEQHGVIHKVRGLIGGDNTIQNDTDIEKYNTKPLFNHNSLTHGDVFTASEIGTAVAGGVSLVKNLHKLIPVTPSAKNLTDIDVRRFENIALRESPQFPKDMEKVGVSKNQIDMMFSKEVPLGFKSSEQFSKFQTDMVTALKKDGLNDSKIGLKGTATTFYSENPSKKLGHHWDANPVELGDYDLNISSKKMTQHMDTMNVKPSEQYGTFKTRHIRLQFPEIDKFSTEWTQILGRDVNFVGYPTNAVKRDSTEYMLGTHR